MAATSSPRRAVSGIRKRSMSSAGMRDGRGDGLRKRIGSWRRCHDVRQQDLADARGAVGLAVARAIEQAERGDANEQSHPIKRIAFHRPFIRRPALAAAAVGATGWGGGWGGPGWGVSVAAPGWGGGWGWNRPWRAWV